MRKRNGTNASLPGPDLGRRSCVVLAGVSAALSLVTFGFEGPAHGRVEAFKLVVHPENPLASASRTFLSDAFLRNVGKWGDGRSIMPVDLRVEAKVRERFSERIHGRSALAVKRYWQQRIFSGSGVPPPELGSDQAVLEYVLKHRGGIGYVSTETPVGKARTLAVR